MDKQDLHLEEDEILLYEHTEEVADDEELLEANEAEDEDSEEETSDEATDEDDDNTEVEVKKERIVPKKAAGEKAEVAEEVTAIFSGSEELSEEFKQKATLVFEAALSARLAEEVEAIEEAAQEVLEQRIAEHAEKTDAQVDEYLSYVVNEWAEDNQVAVESGIKMEVMESLVAGIKELFEAHNISLVDEEVSLLEDANKRADELEDKLVAALAESVEKDAVILEMQQEKALDQLSEGLALTQKEKLKLLAKDVVAESVEEYTEKVTILKESFFAETNNKQEQTADIQGQPEKNAGVSRYVEAARRKSQF